MSSEPREMSTYLIKGYDQDGNKIEEILELEGNKPAMSKNYYGQGRIEVKGLDSIPLAKGTITIAPDTDTDSLW